MEAKFYGVPNLKEYNEYNDMHYVLEHVNKLKEQFLKCSLYENENESISLDIYENGQIFNIHLQDKEDENKFVFSQLLISENEITYLIWNFGPLDPNYYMSILQNKVVGHNSEIGEKIIESFGNKIYDLDIFSIDTNKYEKKFYRMAAKLQKMSNKKTYTNSVFKAFDNIEKTLEKYPSNKKIVEEQTKNNPEEFKDISVNVNQTDIQKTIMPEQVEIIMKMLKVVNKELDVSVLGDNVNEQYLNELLKDMPPEYIMELVKLSNGQVTYEEAKKTVESYIQSDSKQKKYIWNSEQKVIDLTPDFSEAIDEEIEETHSRSR